MEDEQLSGELSVVEITALRKRVAQLELLTAEQNQQLTLVQKALKEAEVASQFKDEFLATVAHELRNPLNIILGWTQILRRKTTDAATSQRALEIIERNAKTQNQIIEDLLDITQLVHRKLRLDLKLVILAEIVQLAIDSILVIALNKGVQVTVNIAADVGTVLGDASRLQQVIWNILFNAIKFTPPGERVEVRLERVSTEVVVTISDTGRGIAPELLPHIFERFRQGRSTTTGYHGLGLGLAIAHQLVELHGGTIEATSPGEGQGATFTIRLTVSTIREEDLRSVLLEMPVAESPSPSLSPTQLKVLVVDSNVEAGNLASIVLRQAQVRSTPSVKVALSALTEWEPDILIGEIAMPDEDSYALIQQVRALSTQKARLPPDTVLTTDHRDYPLGVTVGYQIDIAKPVPLEVIVNIISELTKQSSQ
ncbi:hybrid sensor histidine kinase/response regulator [Candidatus Cyanaurora vandensis]|uniref:hybrid sensor histidine kinase/response regulator n=1 Tax=Candidatus Cyanaurora vandensis TaxID=2714958 RepID=UPI00257DB257|nr:hybrid sensor histidine kinase/response regulator [Candidatus Cyanaurora vandensis]